jgi:hypothetical protein
VDSQDGPPDATLERVLAGLASYLDGTPAGDRREAAAS